MTRSVQLTEFLLQKKKMREEVNALNVNGFTAFDVLLQNRSKSKYMKLEGILRGAGAEGAKVMHRTRDNWTIQPLSHGKGKWKKHIDWLNETRSILMVVAILISTVTFQAGMNPPGGVWEEDNRREGITAGESIMAHYYPEEYILFTIFNVIAFIASLSIILLLTSGFHIKQRIFMRALMIITWLRVSSVIVTYGIGYYTVSTADALFERYNVSLISVLGWLLLNGLLFAAHFFRYVVRLARKVRTFIYTCTYRNKPPSMDPTNVNVGYIDVESPIELN